MSFETETSGLGVTLESKFLFETSFSTIYLHLPNR